MATPINLTPGIAVGAVPAAHSDTESQWQLDVEKVPIPVWDHGVFVTELANLKKLPERFTNLSDSEKRDLLQNPETLLLKAQNDVPSPLKEGTYRDTQLALTKIYDLIEKSYGSFMDTANFEPSLPTQLSIAKKPNPNKDWSDMTPGDLQKTDMGLIDLFNKMRLAQLPSLLPTLTPQTFIGKTGSKLAEAVAAVGFGPMGRPDEGDKISDVEQYNATTRARSGSVFARRDIFDIPNNADLPDWWSDVRFAQQSFTGTNPTTIELATKDWVEHFINAAGDSESDQAMRAKIQQIWSTEPESLYMQDYSYFRKFAGMEADEPIQCAYTFTEKHWHDIKTEQRLKHGTAPVCLFHLPKEGQLQPLAIIIDWRGSAENSVTIYNKELPKSEQKEDWPWRYAKTCVQSADWVRHEVSVHLTLTHMVEEATIVAAQRSFEDTHPVFQLLYPHWQKTLSLNAAGRATLVPNIITELIGFTSKQAKRLIYEEYKNFDFKGRYVPDDLKSRGFDPAQLNEPRYVNYAYGRCIYSMWCKIRSYVKDMLAIHYDKGTTSPDEAVAADESIKTANLKGFPVITNFEDLVDAVTMCIHLASPQHIAVNYLQNYYQAFVINRPPALYHEPPRSRAELDSYGEKQLVQALPMNHPREWLLSSHIPYLRSFKPGDKESLILYAASKYHVYRAKTDPDDVKVNEAAAKFYADLASTESEFKRYSEDTWDAADIQYNVLSPEWNAVSILI